MGKAVLVALIFGLFWGCTGVDTVGSSSGLNQEDYVDEKTTMRFENYIYDDSIKTVQFYLGDDPLSQPIIKLRSGEKLTLKFDDLGTEVKNLSYTVIHCDANWTQSALLPFEYTAGFNDYFINDFKFSFNTLIKYVHYSMQIPNSNVQITKSGNYILMIYKDNDKNRPVITRRFMVYEDLVRVGATVRSGTLVEKRKTSQEIDFTINHRGYEIPNPFQDLHVTLMQNNRWDNAIINLKPLFMNDNELVYNYDRENNFFGGNEYRFFDTKSIRIQSLRVQKIRLQDSSAYHVYLYPDPSRQYKRYSFWEDINGQRVIRIQDRSDSDTDADYLYVHFSYPIAEPIENGNLYVFGALSDWKAKPEYQLHYNYEKKAYEATILLKQGYYNYEYGLLTDGSTAIDNSFAEGTHYETENDYTIFVYHREMGLRYDKLVAVTRLNSGILN